MKDTPHNEPFQSPKETLRPIFEYLQAKNIIRRGPGQESDFAKLLGVSTRRVFFNLFTNNNLPSGFTILLITKLGVRPDFIFKGEKPIFSNEQFEVPIPHQIKTAIKQYLIYFNDFARITKGMEVGLEVKDSKEGLQIEIPQNQDKIKVEKLLDEYFGLVRGKIEEINPEIERKIEENKKDIFLLELRHQVRTLKTSLEIKAVENKVLTETVDFFKTLLLTEKQNVKPILIQTNSSSQAIQENCVNIEIENKIKVKPENREEIQRTIESIKQEILADREIESKFQSDIFALFVELEKELSQEEINTDLVEKILEKSSKVSSIGTFVINLMRFLY